MAVFLVVDSVGDKLSSSSASASPSPSTQAPVAPAAPAAPALRMPRTNSQHQQLNEAFNGDTEYNRRQSHPVPANVANQPPSLLHAHYSDKLKDRLQQDNKNVVHG